MSVTYRDIIKLKYPEKQPIAYLDNTYAGIVWNELDPTPNPTQAELDGWIDALSDSPANVLTKYQFRKLFTFNERLAIDNIQSSTTISAQNKGILSTIIKDLELSGEVSLDNPDVINGVGFLEQVGLLAAGRAAQILSNTPPGA